jgi:hypothetical protein
VSLILSEHGLGKTSNPINFPVIFSIEAAFLSAHASTSSLTNILLVSLLVYYDFQGFLDYLKTGYNNIEQINND